jgi:lysophospholipase L1-like esterase
MKILLIKKLFVVLSFTLLLNGLSGCSLFAIGNNAGESVIVRPYYQHKKQRFESYKTKADIVMVGDSITDGAEWHEMLPQLNIVNRGISGDTTVGVLNRLEGISQTQAKKAFIMIGVNDFSRKRSPELVFENYKKIIQALEKENIEVFVQSTLQVGISKQYHNPRVTKLNQLLQAYCSEHELTFIDLNKVLAPTGVLETKYSLDQLHLTAQGYALWQAEIMPYL